MKIIIIPMSYSYPGMCAAGERIRCTYLAPYLNADIYNKTQNLEEYNVIIYQKAHTENVLPLARKYKHKIQIYDGGEPEWTRHKRDYLKEYFRCMTCVVTPSKSLSDGYSDYYKIDSYVLPDRYDLTQFNEKKIHKNLNYKDITIVWFGNVPSFQRVEFMIPYIKRNGFNFITITSCKVVDYGEFVVWRLDDSNSHIIRGDIVINPLDALKYRSTNKTVLSWLLGMPVAETLQDIEKYLDYNKRILESKYRYTYARRYYDIKQSADDYREIIKLYLN